MKRNLFIILTLSITILSIVHCYVENSIDPSFQKNIVYEPDDTLTVPEIRLEYGIAADSFRMEEGIIGRNQNLSQILSEYNISPSVIHQISLSPRDLFDARRIRTGNAYKIYFSNDSLNLPRYFVYKTDPVEYVKINLSDSIIIERGAKEVRQVVKSASGRINTSLWNAMTDNNVPAVMAIELSEIYAWNIDFFGLRQGDQFSVIYNENYVDSTSAGIDQVIAAYFNHMGRDFYAIPFEQDSVVSFFDQDGNSLRRTFLKAPLRYSRISSGFSHSRLHPILRIRRPHHGVDYAAPVGTPVYAIG
ncbi:MAG: metalloendopeptidase, partial [Bacteroidales bacterium]